MVQLDTRIVLRNDTKANWDRVAATAELMESEIGVETDTGRFKIGKTIVDEQTHQPRLAKWSELEYANDRNSVQVKEGADVNSLDAGDFVGDMGIVKTLIHTDEETGAKTYTHTAYVWNGTAWEAMAGNYDATNVYFKDDITLAGSYTAVGNVTKSSNAATGTLDAAGKTLAQVMQSIFTKELYPATGSNINKPTISLSGDADATGEVGASYTLPTVKLKIDDVGAYTYGPATGIVFSKDATNKLTLAQGAVATATNKVSITENKGAGSDVLSLTAVDTSTVYTDSAISYTFNASGTYTAGVAPKTNLGNLLDTGDDASKWTYRIPSGTATASTRTIKRTGFRRYWYGFIDSTDYSTITRITDSQNSNYNKVMGGTKTLTASSGSIANGTLPTITAAAGDRTPVVVMLKSAGKKVASASMPSSLNAPVTFTKLGEVDLAGYNNATKATYEVWGYIADDMPVGADFSIVIGNA